jgi:hypothetical protein
MYTVRKLEARGPLKKGLKTMPINRAAADDGGDTKQIRPEATQAIVDLLRPVGVAQVTAYLERTGWILLANHFTWEDGWTLQPEIARPKSQVYVKSDPEAVSKDAPRFLVEVPGREEFRDHLSRLQSALERIAAVEQTTFVTVICRILGVEQVVLLPEKTKEQDERPGESMPEVVEEVLAEERTKRGDG